MFSGKKMLLLGAGELGKEIMIEAQRFGIETVAVDRYAHAPAMHVAHKHYVIDMLDSHALRDIIQKEQPDFIVPEIEAIATDELVGLEKEGFNVIPNARATKLTMDREGIRRFASEELNIPTARYQFANTYEEFTEAVAQIGYPCVIKPLMSSSGKGQSICRSEEDLKSCWNIALEGGRVKSTR
ncbi:ATP-grasp domain-containing protein, partial [Strepomyces sp. STD 3.1]|nr:ATP-grasp domain-containing protein [Streptomyces sp. STD 3.1]